MIDVDKIIKKGEFYISKNIDEEKLMNRLLFIDEKIDGKNVQNILSSIYAVIKDPRKNTKKNVDLYLQRKEILIEKIFESVYEILDTERLNNSSLEEYLINNIYPYYMGRFERSMSREISFLPLELRLYIYTKMYFIEEDKNTKWHILDRIYVTLSKMGYKEEAEIICSINWLSDLEDNKSTAIHEFKVGISFIAESKKDRNEIVNQRGFTPERAIDELQNSLSNFINLDLIMDSESAEIMLNFLAIYYEDIPGIRTYRDMIIQYIKTGDPSILEDLNKLKKEYQVKYKAYGHIEASNDSIELISDDDFIKSISQEHEKILKKYVEEKNHLRKIENGKEEITNDKNDDHKDNEIVVLYYKNGKKRYEGELKKNLPNGRGKLYYNSGEIKYDGELEDGKFHGRGILYDKKGKEKYEGMFKLGKKSGHGKIFLKNELYYDGEFKDDEINGQGEMYFEMKGVKMKRVGNFKNGLLSGFGKVYYIETGILGYVGEFKDNNLHGQGTVYDEKGIIDYKGTIINGVATGRGEKYDERGRLVYKG